MENLYKTTKRGIIHPQLQWTNITPQSGHFAFGYYDRNPFSHDNKFHLAFTFDQQTRLPKIGETAIIGLIDMETTEFKPITKTYAWCHQQGCMSQWLPKSPDQFIFNDFIQDQHEKWVPISRVYNINGDHIQDYDYPVYRLAPNGKCAATLNFSRIPRRGYSYACAPLPEEDPLPDIKNDGLFLLDLESGSRKLILPYETIINQHPQPEDYEIAGERMLDVIFQWMNHACFNSDGSRVMVLNRFKKVWDMKTYMWTMNLEGGDLMCSLPHKYWKQWGISHQLWGRTPREIIVDGDNEHTKIDRYHHRYLIFNEPEGADSAQVISTGLGYPGHLIFSPDKQWLVADSYPWDELQYLNLTRVSDGMVKHIGTFFHSKDQHGDWRCDLHPRWSADGNYLSVDTIHYGERKIMTLNVKETITKLFN